MGNVLHTSGANSIAAWTFSSMFVLGLVLTYGVPHRHRWELLAIMVEALLFACICFRCNN
jgi:hypothetical protein